MLNLGPVSPLFSHGDMFSWAEVTLVICHSNSRVPTELRVGHRSHRACWKTEGSDAALAFLRGSVAHLYAVGVGYKLCRQDCKQFTGWVHWEWALSLLNILFTVTSGVFQPATSDGKFTKSFLFTLTPCLSIWKLERWLGEPSFCHILVGQPGLLLLTRSLRLPWCLSGAF